MTDVADRTEAADAPTREQHHAEMADYLAGGVQRAHETGNRGPVRFGPDGKLHPEILENYWKHGFYVFTGVVGPDEIAELRADVGEVIERAPVRKGEAVDRHGRPALGRDYAVEPYIHIAPLSDPFGGTSALGGRHQVQMDQPTPDADAPPDVVYLIFGMCQSMPSALRLYGHPDLMSIAESINGPDFVPYNDAIFVKEPGLGGSVSWHQDGVTHWDNPDWDMGIHGFNFQVQLYETTAANALWVVPGTHTLGRIDLRAKVADNGGSTMLPDAIPLLCEPGDATVVNRHMVHGSYANTSADPRISVTFGFHRRSSVLGVAGQLRVHERDGVVVYDEERVFKRSSVIAVAIDARAQHHPGERRYTYAPFVGLEDDFRFNDETFERVICDYNLNDLAI